MLREQRRDGCVHHTPEDVDRIGLWEGLDQVVQFRVRVQVMEKMLLLLPTWTDRQRSRLVERTSDICD